MSLQITKLVIFVLLIAAAAFVVDVLSPVTPTPNAVGERLLVTLYLLFALRLVFGSIITVASESFPRRHLVADPRTSQRTLIALICVLLC
jgi:hypothetical protein